MDRFAERVQRWNHSSIQNGKVYSTAEVAEVIGFKNHKGKPDGRRVARLIDRGVIRGVFSRQSHWRAARKMVCPDELVRFMVANGVPLDRISENDVDGQKAILRYFVCQLKQRAADAKRRGELFKSRGLSVDRIMEIFENSESMRECLGSKTDMQGCTRNLSWARFLRLFADIIEQHTKVCKANAKKR